VELESFEGTERAVVSAYTSTVRISGLCAAAVRENTFKKNQSTKTCELDPAIRTSTIKTRVRRQRTGGMKPRILTLLLGVRAAMAPDVGCEELERRRGEIQEHTLKFVEDGETDQGICGGRDSRLAKDRAYCVRRTVLVKAGISLHVGGRDVAR
jgi:hypothetical protein